jgi:helicase SWR1
VESGDDDGSGVETSESSDDDDSMISDSESDTSEDDGADVDEDANLSPEALRRRYANLPDLTPDPNDAIEDGAGAPSPSPNADDDTEDSDPSMRTALPEEVS